MGGRRLLLLLSAATLLGCARGGSDCLTYSVGGSGWGSNVFGMLLTLAANPNTDLVLDESGWHYKCSEEGSWRKFFRGTVPMTRKEAPYPDSCEPVQYNSCPRCGHDVLRNRPVDEVYPLMVDAMRRLWKLSDDMQLHADIQAAYLDSLPKPLIGIHVRSGDKANEDQIAGRDPLWFQKGAWVYGLQGLLAQNYLSMQNGGTCLLFGDQLPSLHLAATALKTSLSCTTMIVGGSISGHNQYTFNDLNRTATCDSTRELILSLEAMAKTDVFMGNFNSNVPRLLLVLRGMYGKSQATSKDVIRNSVGWSHNFAAYFEGVKPYVAPIR